MTATAAKTTLNGLLAAYDKARAVEHAALLVHCRPGSLVTETHAWGAAVDAKDDLVRQIVAFCRENKLPFRGEKLQRVLARYEIITC